jgi:zinc protease
LNRSELRSFHIPSETRTLSNGIRVVVHEDRSAPLLSVHLMLHVGSKDEQPGATGLAHLLEHLLFEGTENCPKGEFDILLEEVGGTHNGSTWLDRTNYYETVPTHATDLPLWLERERLAHFLPVLNAEMLELQRGVVINERLQTTENRPYGLADERLHELLFPPPHPYSWPTIGYLQDLERITLDQVRDFFGRFYTPANAVLVLAGDLSIHRGFALAEEYFGDLADGAGPAEGGPPGHTPPKPKPERVHDFLPDRVSFPRIYRAALAPPYGTRDWNALDVLAYLLADGESSRLQRRIVRERELAQDLDTYLLPTELDAVFGIVATARSGVTAEALEEAVEQEIARLMVEPPTEEEVRGAIRRVRRDQLAGLATLEDRSEALAYAATVLGDAEALNRVMDAYLDVTPEDIRCAAESYLVGGRVASLAVTPSGEPTDEA